MYQENREQLDLERRLRTLLPETYEVFDEEVRAQSMGSAGLKFGDDGKVLWDKMWGSFCDLAMAGGPPHRGKLLEVASLTRDDTKAPAYQAVTDEICRGISLVTGLCAEPSPAAGWVQMYCTSAAMTAWLTRAITMENVSAVGMGLTLHLPAGPAFRVEKEIKNVITSVAKTCHYWQDHMSDAKHYEIADVLRSMDREAPLVQLSLTPNASHEELTTLALQIGKAIRVATCLTTNQYGYSNWLGLDCLDLHAAIWMMRALAVSNVLSRREGNVIFFPLNPAYDPSGKLTIETIAYAHRLARAYQLF